MVLLRLEIFRTFSKNRNLGLQQTNDPSIRPSSNLSSQLESLLDRVVLIPQSLFYFRTTRNHEAITFVEVYIFQFGNLDLGRIVLEQLPRSAVEHRSVQ